MKITSVSNKIVKEVTSLHQKKYRNDSKKFLIEGEKGVQEALEAGVAIDFIVCQETYTPPFEISAKILQYSFSDNCMKKVSTTATPSPMLAVAKQFDYDLSDILSKQNALIIILEDIKDPGNLGTIIRTSVAANVDGIIFTNNTVDVYNPKVVRASVGNLWKMPFVIIENKEVLVEAIKSKEIKLYGSSLKAKDSIYSLNFSGSRAIVFGSEAEGMSHFFEVSSDMLFKIPQSLSVESLNLSVSVGIVIYEAFRQRNFC